MVIIVVPDTGGGRRRDINNMNTNVLCWDIADNRFEMIYMYICEKIEENFDATLWSHDWWYLEVSTREDDCNQSAIFSGTNKNSNCHFSGGLDITVASD